MKKQGRRLLEDIVREARQKDLRGIADEMKALIARAGLHPDSPQWRRIRAGAEARLMGLPIEVKVSTITAPERPKVERRYKTWMSSKSNIEHHFTTLDPEDDPGLAELQ